MQPHATQDDEEAVAETPLLPTARRRPRRVVGAAATLVLVGAAATPTARQAMQRLSWTPFDGNLMPPDSWAGFSCELYDDDTRYPVAPWASEDGDPATDCTVQDATPERCEACLNHEVCASVCGEATANCDGGSGSMEFLEPCMWETITNLEDVCGNTFEAVAPLSSANIAPWDALTDTIDWSCPTHAFCNQCADDTEPGGINRYCVALMLKTSSLYPHLDLFDHLESYWCWPEVWQAIEDASFFDAFSDKLNPRLAFEDRTGSRR